MKIIVDAFGGDNAPAEILKGCALAVEEYGVEITAVGDERKLRECMASNAVSAMGIELVHAPSVIPVEADPASIMSAYSDCSMATGMQLLAQGQGEAFVTAGSTGAAVVGASLIVKRIKGIKRAALATVIPAVDGKNYMLVDIGANAECRPEMLVQFGIMGSIYMEQLMGRDKPRVGLVNIGAEETKGLDLHVETYKLLKNAPVNFIGNIEPRDLPLAGCDVAVTDGFVGNVILKLTEGLGKQMSSEMKRIFMRSAVSKAASLLVKGGITGFRRRMDYTEYGGAPLMGTALPVIKAHGSSNAVSFKNAVRQAKEYSEQRVIDRIIQALSQLKQ